MSVVGKEEIVSLLKAEGFPSDEASRAFEVMLEAMRRGLHEGRTIYFKRICKFWPVTRPPRKYWDPFNERYIYFGERQALKIKPLYLKERNILAERRSARKNAKKAAAEMAK